jgi:hypothetical protein
MADAKDILGLRQDGAPKSKSKPSKEPAQQKPEGVSREVSAIVRLTNCAILWFRGVVHMVHLTS